MSAVKYMHPAHAGKQVGEPSLGTESGKLISRQRSQVQARSVGVAGLRSLQETPAKSSAIGAFPGASEGGSPSRVVPAVIGKVWAGCTPKVGLRPELVKETA